MNNLSILIFIAAVIHVLEEFFLPGGFIESAKNTLAKINLSRISGALDNNLVFVINAMFILLCIINIFFGGTVLHYSIAALILFNAITHIAVSIINKRYVPGLVTSVLIYIPLAVYIFSTFGKTGDEMILALAIGILLNFIPMSIVLVRTRFLLRH